MAQISTNVVAAKPKAGGAVWVAPLGTTCPTDAVAALDNKFKSIGYLSEDGIAEEIDSSPTDIEAFGGDVVLTINASHKVVYKFTPIEHDNVETLSLIYGAANVSTKSGVSGVTGDQTEVLINAKEHPQCCFVFEFVLSNGKIERVVVPVGKVTEVGGTSYKDDGHVSNELSVTCFPDEEENKAYKYLAKPAA